MMDFTRDDLLGDYENFVLRVNQPMETVEASPPPTAVCQRVLVGGQWRYKAADLYVFLACGGAQLALKPTFIDLPNGDAAQAE